MKTLGLNRMLVMGFLVTGSMATMAQSTLESEVPGDNFSLEGALELFKKSASPEEFEKMLNSPNSKVNNLDLNNDQYTDYIRVIDRTDRNVHAFILQAVLSPNESQDVAVIELEKLQNGKAILQITGDADVYGIETIIEPTEEVRTYAGTTSARTVVNVWAWPSVQYVYSPYYSVWISPWQWAYQPIWWRAWRPVAYYEYNPWWRPYRVYYSSCNSHRIYYANEIYRPHRTTSVIVVNNYGNQINHYRSNNHYNYHDNNHYSSNNHSGNGNNNHSNGNGNGNNSRSNNYNRDNGSYDRDGNDRNRNNDHRSNEGNSGNQNHSNNNSAHPNENNVNHGKNVPSNQHAEIERGSMNESSRDRSAPKFNGRNERPQQAYHNSNNSGNMHKPARQDVEWNKSKEQTSLSSNNSQRQTNSSFSKPQQRQSNSSMSSHSSTPSKSQSGNSNKQGGKRGR